MMKLFKLTVVTMSMLVVSAPSMARDFDDDITIQVIETVDHERNERGVSYLELPDVASPEAFAALERVQARSHDNTSDSSGSGMSNDHAADTRDHDTRVEALDDRRDHGRDDVDNSRDDMNDTRDQVIDVRDEMNDTRDQARDSTDNRDEIDAARDEIDIARESADSRDAIMDSRDQRQDNDDLQ